MHLPGFIWFPSQPKRFAYFQQVMTVQRAGALDWLSVFPIEKEVRAWSAEPEKALFVDIGGGFGHQCIALKAKHSDLPGRVILQDIPQTLEHVQPIEGVEVMIQNFYEPQAIKGTCTHDLGKGVLIYYRSLLLLTIFQAPSFTTCAIFCTTTLTKPASRF